MHKKSFTIVEYLQAEMKWYTIWSRKVIESYSYETYNSYSNQQNI